MHLDYFKGKRRITSPRCAMITFTFGDWGAICGADCPQCGGHPKWRRIANWLDAASRLIGEIRSGVKVVGRTWYQDESVCEKLIQETPRGVGIRMKEPAGVRRPPKPGEKFTQDNWSDVVLTQFEVSDLYGPVYLAGGKVRHEDFYPDVACGDTDEFVDPVIGLSLPWMAARKIRRIAENGIVNIALWWGGANYTAYSANHGVLREMIWDPFQDMDTVVERVAKRDFGPLADRALEVWRQTEAAVSHWKHVAWKQRFETFVARADQAYIRPVTPAVTGDSEWIRQMLKNAQDDGNVLFELQESLRLTSRGLAGAVDAAGALLAIAEGAAAKRANSQYAWLDLLASIVVSQMHFLAAWAIGRGGARDGLDSEYGEIARAEIANTKRAQAAIRRIAEPNFKLLNWGEGLVGHDNSLRLLDEKIAGMRDWLGCHDFRA